MDLIEFSGKFWTANKMPDTKSGIKHLSNMATMHQNIFMSLQNVFNKQFRSNMKVYSQEMNIIKDDLTRLLAEKEKCIKRNEKAHRQVVEKGNGQKSESKILEDMKHQNQINNRAINKKVNLFSKGSTSRKWSGSTIQEEEEAESEEFGGRSSRNHYQRREGAPRILSAASSRMEDLDEEDEDVFYEDIRDKRPLSSQNPKPKLKINTCTMYKPKFLGWRVYLLTQGSNFYYTSKARQGKARQGKARQGKARQGKNDRFVNSTVNDARAKLTALYRQSILGPTTIKKSITLAIPLTTPGSRSDTIGSAYSRQRKLVRRSQSAAAAYPEKDKESKTPQRKSKSAHLLSGSKSHDGNSPSTDGKPPSVVLFKGDAADRPREQIESLQSRYRTFEEALHRRMLIREMKAAEYDANHIVKNSITLQEVIPSKSSAMSDALRRQSAITALERSILGGTN